MNEERCIIVPVKIRHGSIKCAKCDITLQAPGACPKCGYIHVCIRIGWKGTYHRFYLDKNLRAHDYSSAAIDLANINGQIAAGTFDPQLYEATVIQARNFSYAWSEFMSEKLEEIETDAFAVSTWQMYQTHFLCYLQPCFGEMDTLDFGTREIKLLDRQTAGLSRKYRINIFMTLHAFLNWLKDDKGYIAMIPKFPDFGGGSPLKQSARRESLTVEEQDEAFAKIPLPHRKVFIFESEIGCRPGETGLIDLQDISRNRVLTIRKTWSRYKIRKRTKEGSIREIVLSDAALEIVKEQMHDPETGLFRTAGYLFKNPNGKPKCVQGHRFLARL